MKSGEFRDAPESRPDMFGHQKLMSSRGWIQIAQVSENHRPSRSNQVSIEFPAGAGSFSC